MGCVCCFQVLAFDFNVEVVGGSWCQVWCAVSTVAICRVARPRLLGSQRMHRIQTVEE
ncbi:hypothetical protein M758_6G127800 [Ceratodon purpureus]|nr:hypothetical protein M758_6G127800 [Ceratodon purpureus]